MASKTFKLQNLSSGPAEVTSINFTTPSGVQHSANLSNFGGNLTGKTNFTGSDGAFVVTKNYIRDTKPQSVQFQSYSEYPTATANFASYNTVTNMLSITNASGEIGSGWTVTGAGGAFNGTQTVLSASPGSVKLSQGPLTTVVGTPILTFTGPNPIRQLTVNRNDRILAGWVASSVPTGFTSGQTVSRIIPTGDPAVTVIEMSANPDSPLTAGQSITFSAPGGAIELYVDDTAGIIPGFKVTGNGYTGDQRVELIYLDPPRLIISAHPPGNPVYPGSVSFVDDGPISIIPAGSSVDFTIDYTQTLNTPATVTATMVISANLLGESVIKTIKNTVAVSQAPVENPNTDFTPGGGSGETAPGTVTDSGGSSSGSNWNWIPLAVFIFTGWFW